jgi:hypothetical protein
MAFFDSRPTVTRPANVTPYTAGDVLGGVITFPDIGPRSGAVLITAADLGAAITAIPVGMTSFRLHLYSETPPSALADNAVWDLTAADLPVYLGYIDLGTLVDAGTRCFVQVDSTNIKRVNLAASTSLFGYLVTVGAFTPAANSEIYYPHLGADGL